MQNKSCVTCTYLNDDSPCDICNENYSKWQGENGENDHDCGLSMSEEMEAEIEEDKRVEAMRLKNETAYAW